MVFVALLYFYFIDYSYILLTVDGWIKLQLACLGEICKICSRGEDILDLWLRKEGKLAH